MSLEPHDWMSRLQTLVRPGRYANVTWQTAAFAATAGVTGPISGSLYLLIAAHLFPFYRIGIPATLILIAIVTLLLALFSFVGDVVRAGRLRQQSSTLRTNTASSLARRQEVERELDAVYTRYRPQLIDRLQPLVTPDHYGRRKPVAIATELTDFHDTVATPHLTGRGYTASEIATVFDADKTRLIRGLLRSASGRGS